MKNNLLLPFKLLFTDKTISFDILFFSVLFLLIPFVLITGPALPDIFLSLIALYFLVISILHKHWSYYKNPFVIGFLLFSFYGIIRSCFTEFPLESLSNEGSMFYFRYIFFGMGVWYLLDNNPYIPKCLIVISATIIVIVCLDGLYQYFVGINLFGNEKYELYRLTGFFGNEPIIGRYISYLSIFSFALIYENFEKTKKMMILLVSLLVLSEVIVFLTGERAPLFAIGLFSILIVIFIPHYRIYRLIGVLISIVIIYGILQINPLAKSRMVELTIQEVSQTKIPYLPYGPHHEEHYLSSLKMFKDKPIFGVGTNTYRNECKKLKYNYTPTSCSSHPHNFYLQVLAELGIFGFIFIFIFFIYLTLIGLKQFLNIVLLNKSKQIPFEILLYPMILFVYWWPIIPHMSLYNNWNNALIMLPLGFFLRYFYGKSNYGNFFKN